MSSPRVLRASLLDPPRARILWAMVEVASERGFAGASVRLVTERARVSNRTFYEQFESLRDCFLAVLDLALEVAGGLIAAAFAREECWQDGALSALTSLLVFFDSEPQLTRVWLVEAMAAGPWALQRREEIAGVLRSMIVERWPVVDDQPIEPQLAIGVMASVLGLIQTHLVNEQAQPLIDLLGPLMGLVTAPYVDKRDVAREVERGARIAREIQAESSRSTPPAASAQPRLRPEQPQDAALPAMLDRPGAHRARRCLLFLAEHPGASNREVAIGIGVAHQSQIAKLLADLLAADLLSRLSEGAGRRNSWSLTPRGAQTARALAGQNAQISPGRALGARANADKRVVWNVPSSLSQPGARFSDRSGS